MYTGPNTVKDGLKFGYDTGYGVADNNTSTRFYPGKATVNYLSDGLSNYNIVSGTNWRGATPTYTLGASEFGTPIGTYNTSGTSYMYSHDYVLDDDLSTLSGQTVTFSIYLKRQGTPADVGIRIYDNVSSYTTVYAAATNTFQRFTMSKTLGPNPTRIFVMIDNTNGGIIDFHSPQLEIGVASPFVDGTRSSTESLIDLKRTADMDISNMSFDSSGQPEFDGTDDYINATSMSSFGLYNITILAKPFDTITPSYLGYYPQWMEQSGFYIAQGPWTGGATNESFHIWNSNGTMTYIRDTVSNDWHQFVWNWNGTSYDCYIDGIQKTTYPRSSGHADLITINTNTLRLGASFGTYYYKGDMAVIKMYNQELTTEEVKQNFNAYKNRFNI